MASRGFEFSGMLDGTNATPVIRNFPLGVAEAFHIGDLVLLQADDGSVDHVGNGSVAQVTGVCMEEFAAAAIVADTTLCPIAIITRNQLWRASMDGVTTVKKGVATLDCATPRKISASDVAGGSLILVDNSTLDDDGNTLAEVCFSNATFDLL